MGQESNEKTVSCSNIIHPAWCALWVDGSLWPCGLGSKDLAQKPGTSSH